MPEFTISHTNAARTTMEAAYGLTGKDLDDRIRLDTEQMIRHRVFRYNQRAVGKEEECFNFNE